MVARIPKRVGWNIPACRGPKRSGCVPDNNENGETASFRSRPAKTYEVSAQVIILKVSPNRELTPSAALGS